MGRYADVLGLGAGRVDVSPVSEVKLAEMARYGLASKAPTIKDLAADRCAATMLATVRHLEGASVDDALILFDALMATKLLARAERVSQYEQLRSLARFRKAAAWVAAALGVLVEITEASDDLAAQAAADGVRADPVDLSQVWAQIERVVSREQLDAALATVIELVPDVEADDDSVWRAALVNRYPTVRGFLEQLARVIPWGATDIGAPIVAGLRALPAVLAQRKATVADVAEELVTGSWRGWCTATRSWNRR